ncbi:DUF7840 domain-containing protein [Ketobacter alkanivorans]|uniref:Uncharacterized protein n=1 Tax=Ketobacter alkanivorans TaxID=1917421 RepID=A0A2K9LMP0_9GAMM|nr:DUF4105 domain-containing protein [Ketobacter alkanivorans]AUM13510.1 hypothetical protein Kalk_14240 [Ketobacter alkanivorans]
MNLFKHPAMVFWLLLLLFNTNNYASVSSLNSEQLEPIGAHPTWHRLLHYEASASNNGFTSQVDDTGFFLSPAGKHNPLAEAVATIDAFYAAPANLDEHAVCRFPARWRFLQSELSLPAAAISIADCPEYNQWLNTLNPHSISLVFASSYLNSPSSMFGHTFLRVDPQDIENGSTWLSYAVNFGAELHAEDNSFLYAYKGLFGGYPGFFSVVRYYEKIKEYSRIENRDLWEYNLNLSPQETRNLVSHLWELRNVTFDYYFFDENCSYRLLELLEYARPGTSLREDFGMRAIPIDTIRAVIDGELVDSVTYRPSMAAKLEHHVNQLNDEQQMLAWQLARRQTDLDDERLTPLTPASKAMVIASAYEYLRYLELENPRDQQTANYSLSLLKAISTLPLNKTPPPTPEIAPDQGHKTLLLGLTGGTQDAINFADLRIRLSYHDLTDNRDGYLDGAAINIGELRLRQRNNDSLQIETINFVDINSHAPRTLFLKPVTWRVRAGFERIYSAQDDDLVAQTNGGAGATYALGEHSLVYAMAMGRLEYNELLNHNWAVGAGALAGGLVYLPFGTLQLESNYYQFSDGLERYQHQLIQNINIGRDNAVRLKATHQKQVETNIDEFSLEFRHYF